MTPESAVLVKPHLSSGLSRDGRWAYVVLPFVEEEVLGRHFRVYIIDLEASPRRDWRRLGGEGFSLHTPVFSPDSKRVAVLRDADEGTHVAVFDLEKPNGPYRVIPNLPNATLAYKWLSNPNELCCLGLDEDGVRRIWVWRNGQLVAITPPGRKIVDYTTHERQLAYIYVEEGQDILVVCDASGDELHQFSETRAKGRLCYSPDGQHIAFVQGGRSPKRMNTSPFNRSTCRHREPLIPQWKALLRVLIGTVRAF